MTLQVGSLSVSLGGTLILDGVDLVVDAGERVSVMGPSGAGKSTLLRCIAGLIPPDAGTIFLDDKPLTGIPPHRRPIGLMFQDYALFPHLDVRTNVAYGLRMQDVSKAAALERADELLDLVGLARHRDRLPSGLSGGEQQRVALARTLGPEPAVVLFDEPLGSLDQDLKADLLEAMRSIVEDLGLASVYVTHDRDEAMSFGERVAVMRDGRMARIGTPEQLWDDPGTAFVARFAGHRNIVDGSLIGLGSGIAAVPPTAIHIDPAGPFRGMVRACSFETGRYLVALDVGGQRLDLMHGTALDPGSEIGFRVDESATVALVEESD